jgi:hypothetical protein
MRLERARASAYCSMSPLFSSSRPLVASSHQVKRQRPPMRWHSWCRSHCNSLLWLGSCFLDRKHATARRVLGKALLRLRRFDPLRRWPALPGSPADTAVKPIGTASASTETAGETAVPASASAETVGALTDTPAEPPDAAAIPADSAAEPADTTVRADRRRIGANRDCRRDSSARLSAGRDSGRH